MKNTKLKYGIAALMLSLTLAETVAAESKIPKKRLNEIADQTQFPLADMQACGQAFGTPYSDVATQLETNLQELVNLAGFDVDAFWRTYSKKIGTLAMMTKGDYSKGNLTDVDTPEQVEIRRRSNEFQSACKTMHILAKSAGETLSDTLTKVRPRTAHASRLSACEFSADYYQDRFRKSGKMSDIACFQTAARRELEAAQKN